MDEITKGLLAACRAALPHFPSHKSKVGHQLRAAIAMAELGHVPRRALQADLDIMDGKNSGRFEDRRNEAALRQQIERQGQTGVTQ